MPLGWHIWVACRIDTPNANKRVYKNKRNNHENQS